MATDPTTLLELAKCYDCYGSAGTWNLFELGLWKAYLLTLDPVADTSPNALLEAAKCYNCNGAPGEWQILKLGLLQKILLAITPGSDTSANALLESAKCYDCYGGGGMWMLLELGLLNQISSGGGGSSGLDAGGFGYFSFGTVTLPDANPVFPETTIVPGYDIENTNAVTVSFPNLTSIDLGNLQGGYLNINGNSALTTVTAPLIASVSGSLSIHDQSLIASLSFPSLVTVIGGVNFSSCSGLVTLNLPAYLPTPGTTVNCSLCALNAASVNQILHDCVLSAAWGNAGELVDVSGGTSAAPSGAGIADKATLIGRGANVNTN